MIEGNYVLEGWEIEGKRGNRYHMWKSSHSLLYLWEDVQI